MQPPPSWDASVRWSLLRSWPSCLYFKRLDDLDPSALKQLVVNAITQVKRSYE